jgi:two-component system, cell cycle sensor histidine kinase and response regulator CckA
MHQFTDELVAEQPLAGKKVLFAEDQEHLRTIIGMMIEELGADVVPVEDGNNVIERYSADIGGIDLVLMDIRMTGLGGSDTFKRLVEIDPTVKVVLTSGTPPDTDLVDMLIKHHGGFIEKPFNLDHLGKVLSKVLAGEHIVQSF